MAQEKPLMLDLVDRSIKDEVQHMLQKLQGLRTEVIFKLQTYELAPGVYSKKYYDTLKILSEEIDSALATLENFAELKVINKKVFEKYKNRKDKPLDQFKVMLSTHLDKISHLQDRF